LSPGWRRRSDRDSGSIGEKEAFDRTDPCPAGASRKKFGKLAPVRPFTSWIFESSLFTLLALTGCSGDDDSRSLFRPGPPLPECPDADYSTCDVRDATCQERLLELASCMRGTEPPKRLKVDVLSQAAYTELLREDAEDTPEPKLQHSSRALSLFGLAPKNGVPFDDQLEEQASFISGEYRADEQRIVVVDHGLAPTSASVNGVLLHELVHALQDAEHDLETWPGEDVEMTFDASLAASTVVEGEASFYESRVSAPLFGLDYARFDFEAAFQGFMDRALVRAFDSSLLLSQSFRTIPYGVGALRAFHLWEEGGPPGLEPLWSEPPLTMQRVLAETFGSNTPVAAGVTILSPDAPEGLTLYGDDVLGAWGLCLVLTKHGGDASRVTDFIDQALTWRGDRFSVFTDADDSTYALWQLELESSKAARALNDLFAELDVDHVDHGTAGARVFVSYNMNELPASAELTAAGESFLASGSD
jgi:hypothetical protein